MDEEKPKLALSGGWLMSLPREAMFVIVPGEPAVWTYESQKLVGENRDPPEADEPFVVEGK